jgi:RNA polymerase sigma-70 factor (ECF subfamily)
LHKKPGRNETEPVSVGFQPPKTKAPQPRGAKARSAVSQGGAGGGTAGAEQDVAVAVPQPEPEEAAPLGALIARAQSGDRLAFEALLAQVRPRAMAVAMKVLRNPDDAEDAVQEAFVKIWRHLGRFERRSSFTTWIHRIVMNSCLDLLRRQSCRPGALAEDEADRGAAPRETAHEETPERKLVAVQTGRVVRGALEVLSPAHREAITLREFEDCSYEEIAQASGCPVGTVMSRLHHARRRLADELRAAFEPGDAFTLCAA